MQVLSRFPHVKGPRSIDPEALLLLVPLLPPSLPLTPAPQIANRSPFLIGPVLVNETNSYVVRMLLPICESCECTEELGLQEGVWDRGS